MKAMILAAGLGTRLRPFTEHIPKPLFPIPDKRRRGQVSGRPILDGIIRHLHDAGCDAIMINTHHLSGKVEAFVAAQDYPIPVLTRYEPVILGTGGAMRNVADFWDDRPFMVINSDIVTDIDLGDVCRFHATHPHPATLVLHDDPAFNTVSTDHAGFITDFRSPLTAHPSTPRLTFTGIQVLDPEVLDVIPAGVCSSSIDAYEKLISAGKRIKAYVSDGCHWTDIGTPERYKAAVIDKMAPEAFGNLEFETGNWRLETGDWKLETGNWKLIPLKGDGSDRKWYRLKMEEPRITSHASRVTHHASRITPHASRITHSLVMVDHGIRQGNEGTAEVDACVRIGRHLHNKGIPVPEIHLYDTFSGLVFMEDLGDMHLQQLVRNTPGEAEIISCYQSVIDILVRMSVLGAEGFDPSWTCQTAAYDRDLILEKECRYFVDAFLRGYVGSDSCFEDFGDEFAHLADQALEFSTNGFMHRDLQSRNIMVNHGRFRLIDFQGGRMGPIQYDLASLLIDPYVELPFSVQSRLVDYCIERLSSIVQVDPDRFRAGYQYCSITRNLQILGAFSHLTRVKGKTCFEPYIPVALRTLRRNLSVFEDATFPLLKGRLQFVVPPSGGVAPPSPLTIS